MIKITLPNTTKQVKFQNSWFLQERNDFLFDKLAIPNVGNSKSLKHEV